jgi:hypothetical protein
MFKMKRVYYLIIFVFVFQSCEKEEVMVKYMPLKVGNYWVYGHYWTGTNMENLKPFAIDSIYIKRDTLINGLRFYVLEGKEYFRGHEESIIDIVRYSSDCIVNVKGEILFSSTNFTDVLNKTEYSIEDYGILAVASFKMEKPNFKLNVPAGSFSVLNYKGTITENYYFSTSWENLINKSLNTYYAPNVGKIQDAYIYVPSSSPYLIERKLIRYKVGY